MGGKSGGGASTPYEAPNTLNSAQSLRIIDAICEGEIRGFANGNDKPWKSVYFDDTPVQNPDGSFNFKGVVGFFQRGTPDQTYIPGFDASERAVPVSVEVKNRAQVVRAVSDELISRLRVTLGVERNYRVEDNGDTNPAQTTLLVELLGKDGVAATKLVSFTEKSSGVYYQDVVFDSLPPVPFNIRVSRPTPDSTTDKVINKTYFASYVEIIDAKLSYPHTALAALAMDSDQFGSNNPRRNYLIDGMLVNVPSNYDPETRTYSGTVWDGSFKKAWTNNPAWVFYDVLTQPRYSTLARRLKSTDIDKWTLYQVGKYCDELVDDGFGGKEPRFVCNAYITNRRQAGEFLLDLASVFRGLPVWDGSRFSLVMDADSDPVAMYNNSNVKDGLFAYSGVPYKSITTAVIVQYVDKYDGYRTKTEYVEDQQAIKRYGLNIKQITAFGCDSRGQAARYGAWMLETELRQQSAIKFTVGREGLRHLPYDVVQIMDNDYAGAEVSGRLVAVSGLSVTLDRDAEDAVGRQLSVETAAGIKSLKVMAQPEKNRLELAEAADIEAGGTWILMGRVKPRLYRVIGTKENADDGTFEVSGILHDPKKYTSVDNRARFDSDVTTLHGIAPKLTLPELRSDGDKLVISWENLTADGSVLSYDIKIYRDNKLYRHIPNSQTAEIALENLPNGQYRAEIRGRNARGVLSEPIEKGWGIDYEVKGVKVTPRINAVQIDWYLSDSVMKNIASEIWYSREGRLDSAVKLASLAYPQTNYTLTGVSLDDIFYFWMRVIDSHGNAGEFTKPVMGKSDPNPAPILKQIQGSLGKDSFSAALWKDISSVGMTEEDVDKKIGNIKVGGRTLKNLDDSLTSVMTLTTEGQTSDGKKIITGIAQGIDGKTGQSEFAIRADKFALVNPQSNELEQPFVVRIQDGKAKVGVSGDLVADGTILGRHIAASQRFESPDIHGGNLNIGNGNFVVNNDGSMVASNAVIKGRIEADSGYFNGTVKASHIEGDVMRVHRMSKVGSNVWQVVVYTDSVPTLFKPDFMVYSWSKELKETRIPGNGSINRNYTLAAILKLNGAEVPKYPYTATEIISLDLNDDSTSRKMFHYRNRIQVSYGWQVLRRNSPNIITLELAGHEELNTNMPVVITAYLSRTDPEYKALSGGVAWKRIKDISYGEEASHKSYLSLPNDIYGVQFNYKVSSSDNRMFGIDFDKYAYGIEGVLRYSNHGAKREGNFVTQSDSLIPFSRVVFNRDGAWEGQTILLTDVQVLVDADRVL